MPRNNIPQRHANQASRRRVPKFLYGASVGIIVGVLAVGVSMNAALNLLAGLIIIAAYLFLMQRQRSNLGSAWSPRKFAPALIALHLRPDFRMGKPSLRALDPPRAGARASAVEPPLGASSAPQPTDTSGPRACDRRAAETLDVLELGGRIEGPEPAPRSVSRSSPHH